MHREMGRCGLKEIEDIRERGGVVMCREDLALVHRHQVDVLCTNISCSTGRTYSQHISSQ